jgi:hypothetical protein
VITKFQWQIQGNSGSSGELWIDEIHLIDYFIDRPIEIGTADKRAGVRGSLIDCITGGVNGSIGFTLAHDGPVSLSLYDLTGRLVGILVQETRSAGANMVNSVAIPGNGTYVVRLCTRDGVATRQMIIGR